MHFHILYDGEPRYTAYSDIYMALLMAQDRRIRGCTCGTFNVDNTECSRTDYERIRALPLDDIDCLVPLDAGVRHESEHQSTRDVPAEAQMKRWHRRELRMRKSGAAVRRIAMRNGKAYLG